MKIVDELIPLFLIDVMEDGDAPPSVPAGSSTISQNNLGQVLPTYFPKFIKKRKKLIEPYKDFRKSQNAKGGWRSARYNHLKGIRAFAKCLTGNTKISLLDGREVPIKDLVGLKEFYVYSMDLSTNTIVPGRATNCKLTRPNMPIVKITFIDKDGNVQSERCTLDHPWLLTNGRYVEAVRLQPGDSLSSLYRRVKNDQGEYVSLDKYPRGYEELLQPDGEWRKTYRIVFEWKYGKDLHKAKMYIAHHKTFNSRNNSPSAVIACTWRCSPEFVKKRLLDYKDSTKARKYRYGVRVEEGVKKYGFESNEQAIASVNNLYSDLGSIKYKANKIGCSTNFVRSRLAPQNHTVISVEFDGYEDTYDFIVDTHHNFALSSGVFVHNSVAGKKFHKNLATFIVNRQPGDQHVLNRYESSELVSHLSSFRTHILLELNYYKPLSEEVDFFNAVEVMIKLVDGYSAEILESVYSYNEFEIKEDLYDNIIRMLEPAGIIHAFALKSGKSEAEVEKLWGEAQDIVKDEYKKGEDDEGFWALVTGTLKKILGIESKPEEGIVND